MPVGGGTKGAPGGRDGRCWEGAGLILQGPDTHTARRGFDSHSLRHRAYRDGSVPRPLAGLHLSLGWGIRANDAITPVDAAQRACQPLVGSNGSNWTQYLIDADPEGARTLPMREALARIGTESDLLDPGCTSASPTGESSDLCRQIIA